MIYRDVRGIRLPLYAEHGAPLTDVERAEVDNVFRGAAASQDWIALPPAEVPKPLDVLLMWTGGEWHVGVAVQGSHMVHCPRGRAVRLDSYVRAPWRNFLDAMPDAGAYRYAHL